VEEALPDPAVEADPFVIAGRPSRTGRTPFHVIPAKAGIQTPTGIA
jgi:hypothetical protein